MLILLWIDGLLETTFLSSQGRDKAADTLPPQTSLVELYWVFCCCCWSVKIHITDPNLFGIELWLLYWPERVATFVSEDAFFSPFLLLLLGLNESSHLTLGFNLCMLTCVISQPQPLISFFSVVMLYYFRLWATHIMLLFSFKTNMLCDSFYLISTNFFEADIIFLILIMTSEVAFEADYCFAKFCTEWLWKLQLHILPLLHKWLKMLLLSSITKFNTTPQS